MNLSRADNSRVDPDYASSYAPSSLTLLEIAKNDRYSVVLPALQRGAVWKSQQVEEVWDSLLRGFPIGSFLLTPIQGNERLGQRPLQNASEAANPSFYLLDGQQRWSAISLGFQNIWESGAADGDGPVRSTLWIDLEPPERGVDGRVFLFRVTSCTHPWGFQRTDASKRLVARDRRDALAAYEAVKPSELSSEDFRPGKLQLQHAWPWQAKAPIPFSMLVEVVNQDVYPQNVWAEVKEALSRLPYWNADELRSYYGNWKKNVLERLDHPQSYQEKIVDGVKRVLCSKRTYQIPIQILATNEPETVLEGADAPDQIETLFVRINSAGTSLEGEELRYSILKSAFPEAQGIAESLGTRLMSPARLVTLISRLVLARIEKEENDRLNKQLNEPPTEPDVRRFRRLVDGSSSPTFKNVIRCYLGISAQEPLAPDLRSSPLFGRGKRVLDAARELLGDNLWGLPQALVADLARSPSGVEALFLLLAWLDQAFDADINFRSISDDEKRRLVGVVTTLAWFTERPRDCLKALWKNLNDKNCLNHFFSKGLLLACVKPNLYGQLCLIPPLPPEQLDQAVQENVLSSDGFDDPIRGEVWSSIRVWSWPTDFSCPTSAEEWLRKHFDSDDTVRGAWLKFVEKLLQMRHLVIYAQRQKICQWFPHYNPAAPDQIDDADRPWDFDHIHPGNFGGVNSIPRIIRAWHSSIGNLRAWPLEVNRDHGDIAPGLKLNYPIPKEQNPPYSLSAGQEIRAASFISESTWRQWRESTPNGENPPIHNYLVYPQEGEYAPCRAALIEAITIRWVALYREWYRTLLIDSLFETTPR